MTIRIEVTSRPEIVDSQGEGILRKLRDEAGIRLARVTSVDVSTFDWDLTPDQVETVRSRLLCDPIAQVSAVNTPVRADFRAAIEIGFLPGVTDNVGRTTREAVEDLLSLRAGPDQNVYSSRLLLLDGDLSPDQAREAAARLHNPLIQRVKVSFNPDESVRGLPPPKVRLAPNPRVDRVSLEVPDPELLKLGKEGILDRIEGKTEIRRGPLALGLTELNVIRDYFRSQKRDPTDVELESLAQTWSEHCKHTIFAAKVDEIDSIYKSLIKQATNEVRRRKGDRDGCVSVFSDNSGVVRFTTDFNICYKVETHNSPSALDPYGGAITGIVGVNRDPLGTGIGAKLCANMYGFCFGNPFWNQPLPTRRPDGGDPILHPRVIFEGVRQGVEHGGNKSGIPTPWGFLYFDDRYMGKPLVFVGTLGIMPVLVNGRPSHEKQALPGDYIVVAGGRVGKDGIHGATFSSESLHEGSPTGAVQIGDPITQKKLGDAQLEARDLGLYRSVTDCGAGGISCSVGEMARESGGCEVELTRVPIKYAGLAPYEIWISESQERMTYAVAPETLDAFLDLLRRRDVEASVIGRFTDSGRCVVTFRDERVMDVDLTFLHDGLPKKVLESRPPKPLLPEPDWSAPVDVGDALAVLLSRLNVASKEYVVRQYDHEVQAGSTLKPLIGVDQNVHSDAVIVRPLLDRMEGVSLSSCLFPSYGDTDPYAMAACAIETAWRQVVAVGTDPERIYLLDNFCWCSSDEPERLNQLKLAGTACYDMALAFETPFVSGKDSMFNDFKGFDACGEPLKISVPPTLLISAVGVVEDVRRTSTLEPKCAGDRIWILGITRDEWGATEGGRWLAESQGLGAGMGGPVPQVDAPTSREIGRRVALAIQKGLLASVQALNLGGLAVALGKAVIASRLGLSIDLNRLPSEAGMGPTKLLFSESTGRFLVTVAPSSVSDATEIFKGLTWADIGEVTSGGVLELSFEGSLIAALNAERLRTAYTKTFDW